MINVFSNRIVSLWKISEEAGLQILGPDEDGIRRVRVISWAWASTFLSAAFAVIGSKPSEKFFMLIYVIMNTQRLILKN